MGEVREGRENVFVVVTTSSGLLPSQGGGKARGRIEKGVLLDEATHKLPNNNKSRLDKHTHIKEINK